MTTKRLSIHDVNRAYNAGGDNAAAGRPFKSHDEVWAIVMGDENQEDYIPSAVVALREAFVEGERDYY